MTALLEPFINNIQTGVTRSFGTPFTLDATHQALVVYSVQLDVQAPLLSTQSETVIMYVEGIPTPTVEVCRAHLTSGQLAGLGLVSIATGAEQVLMAWVPAGYNVLMSESGGGSASIVAQLEVVFNDA